MFDHALTRAAVAGAGLALLIGWLSLGMAAHGQPSIPCTLPPIVLTVDCCGTVGPGCDATIEAYRRHVCEGLGTQGLLTPYITATLTITPTAGQIASQEATEGSTATPGFDASATLAALQTRVADWGRTRTAAAPTVEPTPTWLDPCTRGVASCHAYLPLLPNGRRGVRPTPRGAR